MFFYNVKIADKSLMNLGLLLLTWNACTGECRDSSNEQGERLEYVLAFLNGIIVVNTEQSVVFYSNVTQSDPITCWNMDIQYFYGVR